MTNLKFDIQPCATTRRRRRLIPLIVMWAASFGNCVSSLMQNVCGTSYNHALECGTPCPEGKNEECPNDQWCFIDIDCPVTTILNAKSASMSTDNKEETDDDGGDGGGGRQRRKKKQKNQQLQQRNGDTNNDTEEGANKHIIGYYASWQLYDRSQLAKPVNMDFNKITRINFAFFQNDIDGNIWGTDVYADPLLLFGEIDQVAGGSCQAGSPNCQCSWAYPGEKSCSYHIENTGLISLVHAAGKEIYPSIGGWTLSGLFPTMAADPTSRKKFAVNCRKLVEDYDFDGIDIDWEYPGYAEHMGTPEDKENYSLLLRDIRQELDILGEKNDRFYGLTAALPCGTSNINNIEVETVSEYLTEFNLMTYDFHGSWDATTGVNSPLWDGPNDPEPGWSVDGCVKNWVSRGAPQQKLNIGLAFYGRSFRDAKTLNVSHGGADYANWGIDEGTPQYFNIVDQIKDMKVVWDDQSATPYAYSTDGSMGLVSYDDERSICLKTEYALTENLQGFIIWELSGDVMADLSTPLLDMVNTKLSETSTDCSNPNGPKRASIPLPVSDSKSSSKQTTQMLAAEENIEEESVASSIAGHTKSSSTKNEDSVDEAEDVVTEEFMAAFAASTQEDDNENEGGGRGSERLSDATTSTNVSPSKNTNYDSTVSSGTAIQVVTEDVQAQLINAYYDGRDKVKRNRDNEDPNKPYRPMKFVVEKEFS